MFLEGIYTDAMLTEQLIPTAEQIKSEKTIPVIENGRLINKYETKITYSTIISTIEKIYFNFETYYGDTIKVVQNKELVGEIKDTDTSTFTRRLFGSMSNDKISQRCELALTDMINNFTITKLNQDEIQEYSFVVDRNCQHHTH